MLMKTLPIIALLAAFSVSACRSKENDAKKQRTENLKKDLVELYLVSAPALASEKNQTVAQTQLAISLAKTGQSERARRILDKGYETISNRESSTEKDAATNLVAKAFVEAKFPERTLAMLPSLPASKQKDEIQIELIRHYSGSGDLKLASKLIGDLKGSEAKESGRTAMLVEMVKSGKVNKALEQVDALKDPANIGQLFLASVKKRLEQKNGKEAVKLLETMEGGNARNRAQGALVLNLWRAGQNDEALKKLEGIESIWIRAKTRTVLSNKLYQSRQYKKSKVFGEKAIEELKTISDASVREAATEDLAELFLESKRTKEALDLGRLIQTPEGLVTVHSALVEAYALVGRFDETKKLTKSLIQQPINGAAGLGRLAEIYAQDNQYVEALDTANDIAIMELRLPVLAQLAVMHKNSGLTLSDEVLSAFESAMKPQL